MAKTGIVRDERYLEHETGSYHVETPERLALKLFQCRLWKHTGRHGQCDLLNLARIVHDPSALTAEGFMSSPG